MVGFASRAAMVTAENAGKTYQASFAKTPWASSTGATNLWSSHWLVAGFPAAGAVPATTPGTTYTSAAGTISFPDRSGENKYLSRISVGAPNGAQAYSVMVYDRLVAVSGISLTTTGSKTISSAALPRYTTGDNVSVWLEVTTGINAAASLSMDSYTNEAGGTSAGTSFSTGVVTSQGMVPVPMLSGDKGVRAVSTLNVTAAASSTGIVSVVLLKPIAMITVNPGMVNEENQVFEFAHWPRIYDGASLAFAWMRGANAAPAANDKLIGTMHVVYG